MLSDQNSTRKGAYMSKLMHKRYSQNYFIYVLLGIYFDSVPNLHEFWKMLHIPERVNNEVKLKV